MSLLVFVDFHHYSSELVCGEFTFLNSELQCNSGQRILGGFSECHVIFLTPSSPLFIFDSGLLHWNKNSETLAREFDHRD